MKILKFVLIFTLILTVIGCEKDPVIEDPIIKDPLVCGDNQEEVDGQCVIVDQALEDIKIALNETIELTNYKINVLVTYSENALDYAYEMTLSFDDQVALFEMGDQDIVYYEFESTGINEYIKQGDAFVIKTVDEVQNYGFYQDLDPKWFTKIDEYYLMGSQYLSNITEMIEDYFPDGAVNNFKVGLGDQYLDYFMFDVILGEVTYHLTFTFDMIGEVALELPTV